MTTEVNDTAQSAVDALWHKLTMDVNDHESLSIAIDFPFPPTHLEEQLTAIVEEYLKSIVRDEVDRLSSLVERVRHEGPEAWKCTGTILEASIHQLQDYIGEVE